MSTIRRTIPPDRLRKHMGLARSVSARLRLPRNAALVPAGPEPPQSKNRSVRISMLSRGREPGPLRGSSNVPCAVQRAVPSVFES